MTKKSDQMKKDLEKKKAALITLQGLNGKTVTQMSKAEQEALITALCQLLNLAGADGKINVQ